MDLFQQMQALYISSMTHNYEDLLKTKSTTFTLQKKEFKNLLKKLLDKNKTLINELNSVHEKYSKSFERIQQIMIQEAAISSVKGSQEDKGFDHWEQVLHKKSLQKQMKQLKVRIQHNCSCPNLVHK